MTLSLSELEELCAKATQGPWHIGHINENNDVGDVESPIGEWVCASSRNNEAFICAARTALPELIAEVKRLRE